MKNILLATIMAGSLAFSAIAAEPPAESIPLKDGSTLFVHPDGTSRMVDVHGKPMAMNDGVEMETADGRVIVHMNKKVWVHLGPPSKGTHEIKSE